jgi:hypothetical protein
MIVIENQQLSGVNFIVVGSMHSTNTVSRELFVLLEVGDADYSLR